MMLGNRTLRYAISAMLGLIALAGLAGCSGSSSSTPSPTVTATPVPTPVPLTTKRLSKADPDECFYGVGNVNNLYPATSTCPQVMLQGAPSTPNKVNPAYVWGLTQTGNTLWFGTAPNVLCLVIGTLLSQLQATLNPILTDSYVCEFGQSIYRSQHPAIPPALGDVRPPQIYYYNTATQMLTVATPNDPLLAATVGIRSAGNENGVVFLGGPNLLGGVSLFAFNSASGAYLGSTNLTDYSDIRQWLSIDGVLYTGVQNKDGTGSVLRWTGSVANPFEFETVGMLDLEAGNLAEHQGRLFVTTWPGFGTGVKTSSVSGLWMSPVIPSGGLTSANANNWVELWKVSDYEPDPVTAKIVAGGAVHSYDGYLYWGTMQVPLSGAAAHFIAYPPTQMPPPAKDIALAILGSNRAIGIFRCCSTTLSDTNPEPDTELLYGDAKMGVYSPSTGWSLQPNAMGGKPGIYGHAGFGNPFNAYTWSMSEYNSSLYVGTFDWSVLLPSLPTVLKSELGLDILGADPAVVDQLTNFLNSSAFNSEVGKWQFGGDLWAFFSAGQPAVPESLNGLGNPYNYGFRTMVSDADSLYMGMANPFNLALSPGQPNGGWELWGGTAQ